MSSADVAVQVFRKLNPEDLKVLQVIETGMKKHEFVPQTEIARHANIPPEKIDRVMSRIDKLGLIYRWQGAYVGYTLNYAGYDCLAINALVKAEAIKAFGKPLGVGKEADVYDALNPQDVRVAVKFHRLGRVSFRQTRRKRGYMPNHASWLFQSRLAAEKEFQALTKVHQHGVAVPEPLLQNRHVIVMGMIEGAELSKWKELQEPIEVLREILVNIKKAYLEAKVIHADLSEYNIILKPDMHILLIDWPQAVSVAHPNAADLLCRDVKNVVEFFNRKFRLNINLENAVAFTLGKVEALTF